MQVQSFSAHILAKRLSANPLISFRRYPVPTNKILKDFPVPGCGKSPQTLAIYPFLLCNRRSYWLEFGQYVVEQEISEKPLFRGEIELGL